MKFSDSIGIKSPQWQANEQVVNTDINFLREIAYKNMMDALAALLDKSPLVGSSPDIVMGEGLYLEWSAAMTANLHPGMALSYTGSYINSGVWGFSASSEFVFCVVNPIDVAVAVDVGDASDRYDTIEIRPTWNDYDNQLRYYKDPISGTVTQSSTPTRVHFSCEVQVLKGTAGSGAAPNHTAGWIKIAEVFVPANATALTQENYYSALETNSSWTAETTVTARKRFDYKSLTGTPGFNRGLIVGGIDILSSAIKVMAGSYEVEDGTMVSITSATTVSTFFGGTFSGGWHYICMNKQGSLLGVIAKGYTIGKTYSIQSITGGNTIAVTSIAGGVQPVAGMIAMIKDTTSGNSEGYFNISSVTGSPVSSIVIDGTTTNQAGAAGTLIVYYPMSTYHFGVTGARVDAAAASDVSIYTPSPTDSLLANNFDDAAAFSAVKNGYYLSFDGVNDLTGYRIIGVAYRNVSAAWSMCVSYKSGRNKNDNIIEGIGDSGVSTLTAGNLYYGFASGNFKKIWGNDYLITDDSTNGFKIKSLCSLHVDFSSGIYMSLLSPGADHCQYDTGLYSNNTTLLDFITARQTGLGYLANYEDHRTYKLLANSRIFYNDYLTVKSILQTNPVATPVMYAPHCVLKKQE